MTTNEFQRLASDLSSLLQNVRSPFWGRWDFWIFVVLGIAGLVFSVKAFLEARQAKTAARDAGRTVKIQTVTLELSDISPKLERLEPSVKFSDARNLLNEISRKLRRISAPFAKEPFLRDKILELNTALDKAKESLNKVRPNPGEEELAGATYNAIEADFATISNFVADLSGLFEKETINFGDHDGEQT